MTGVKNKINSNIVSIVREKEERTKGGRQLVYCTCPCHFFFLFQLYHFGSFFIRWAWPTLFAQIFIGKIIRINLMEITI